MIFIRSEPQYTTKFACIYVFALLLFPVQWILLLLAIHYNAGHDYILSFRRWLKKQTQTMGTMKLKWNRFCTISLYCTCLNDLGTNLHMHTTTQKQSTRKKAGD